MKRMGYIGLQIHPQLLFPSHNKCGLYLKKSICNLRIIFENKRKEKNWSISSIRNVCKNLPSWIWQCKTCRNNKTKFSSLKSILVRPKNTPLDMFSPQPLPPSPPPLLFIKEKFQLSVERLCYFVYFQSKCY